ncbi:hypothetical protein CEUSTIGMA_g11455.t1 [Chlamydomonas eustigma]|uniref:U6 small nuclear RNA (adenine-(43)-N(6))-methyltransferase n=1 Tax=Chlamydomonas eustigma TaxID=1157962 RepID=A0A250XLQ6_9CHLO|nr:hypothetical protein CEUSTIGMA_g11455.t1 [Chlamydomonas eustigma]|eukprot:GAX84031.1 hypothetical protein CEUSTIGMA_g11455.t1 [Chlamydomonas eustigma]
MEQELRDAISLYNEQIENLNAVILNSTEDQSEAVQLREQLQEALTETRGVLRNTFGQSIDRAGGYATSASAAAGMDIGDEEEGQEAESKQSDLLDGMEGAVEEGPEIQSRGHRGGRSNNARMHPSNRYYREEPDFAGLARDYEEIRQYVTFGPDGRAHYDFTSWEATRQLTATLLSQDFGVSWWLPEGQLVPTLTNRANYIHWINDLLQLSSPEGTKKVRGLDIGCGANFIYPLLGAAIYGWKMVGCDVTDVALQWSRRHVTSNPDLAPLLEVRDSRRGSHLGPSISRKALPKISNTRNTRNANVFADPMQMNKRKEDLRLLDAEHHGSDHGGRVQATGGLVDAVTLLAHPEHDVIATSPTPGSMFLKGSLKSDEAVEEFRRPGVRRTLDGVPKHQELLLIAAGHHVTSTQSGAPSNVCDLTPLSLEPASLHNPLIVGESSNVVGSHLTSVHGGGSPPSSLLHIVSHQSSRGAEGPSLIRNGIGAEVHDITNKVEVGRNLGGDEAQAEGARVSADIQHDDREPTRGIMRKVDPNEEPVEADITRQADEGCNVGVHETETDGVVNVGSKSGLKGGVIEVVMMAPAKQTVSGSAAAPLSPEGATAGMSISGLSGPSERLRGVPEAGEEVESDRREVQGPEAASHFPSGAQARNKVEEDIIVPEAPQFQSLAKIVQEVCPADKALFSSGSPTYSASTVAAGKALASVIPKVIIQDVVLQNGDNRHDPHPKESDEPSIKAAADQSSDLPSVQYDGDAIHGVAGPQYSSGGPHALTGAHALSQVYSSPVFTFRAGLMRPQDHCNPLQASLQPPGNQLSNNLAQQEEDVEGRRLQGLNQDAQAEDFVCSKEHLQRQYETGQGTITGRQESPQVPDDFHLGGILLPAFRGQEERFTFCMCNPPFFGSMSEAASNPSTACGGTAMEMVYPGGELKFVMQMVEDSVRLGARIHWYTTMLGKKVTLKALRKELHARHVTAIRTTELVQGKTSRWAIAWSFEVDPNLANQPLPRALNPLDKPSPHITPKRLVSFKLQGAQDGRKLLKAMEASLIANGATNVAMDFSMWTLTAEYSVSEGSAVADSTTTALSNHQKRQRHPNLTPTTVTASPSHAHVRGQRTGGGTVLRINIYQQRRGEFYIMASIAKTASDALALLFTMMMQKVQDDVTASWC